MENGILSPRRLQVFVSSTFEDLQGERQAAVSAILKAGHIPAGMELFAAGDKSQLELIRSWIEASDVFMLILGGRYGSREPESGRSYTHTEYLHALDKGKRVFSVVLDDAYIKSQDLKPLPEGDEKDLTAFKALVLGRQCRHCSDLKDIQLGVWESMQAFSRDPDLPGWVSGSVMRERDSLVEEVRVVREELGEEREKSEKRADEARKAALATGGEYNGMSREELVGLLREHRYKRPSFLARTGGGEHVTLLEVFRKYERQFATGLYQPTSFGIAGAMEADRKFGFEVGKDLLKYGLLELTQRGGLRTIRLGHKLLVSIERSQASKK